MSNPLVACPLRMHPGCGTLESSTCVYAPNAPTAVRATTSALSAHTHALSFIIVFRDVIARRFSTLDDPDRRVLRCRNRIVRERAGSVLASPPIDGRRDARTLSHCRRDVDRATRPETRRDATRRDARCDDGSPRIVVSMPIKLQKHISLRTVGLTRLFMYMLLIFYFAHSRLSQSHE
jgi:hypothetical protein